MRSHRLIEKHIERTLLENVLVEEELMIEEDRLINDYLENSLSEASRKLFERAYISSPIRRNRVRLADALLKTAVFRPIVKSSGCH
jgi:hypothetical protein